MKKTRIRLAALALCVLLFVTMLPATALASAAVDARTALLSAVSNGAPKITYQPRNQSVKQGNTATFQVKASGSNLKYQWYYRKNASAKWTKYTGKTEPVLTFTAGRKNGYQYACKVISGSKSVLSNAATLKVNYVKYRALLIGEVDFGWDYATRNMGDVKRMKSMLGTIKPPMGGSYEVTCKYDLSNSGIKSAIKTAFAGADSNDVSLFFIATHGETSVASGGDAGAICTVTSYGTGMLRMGTLAGWLAEVPGKVIVIIGSCGSGAAISANGMRAAGSAARDAAFCDAVVSAFAANDTAVPSAGGGVAANIGEFCQSKFYVLTAAKHMESSWGQEGGSQRYSYNYFPYYIAKGAVGPADADSNGRVTLDELYNYVYKNALGPYNDGHDNYYQHARVYPENSDYVLFKTP